MLQIARVAKVQGSKGAKVLTRIRGQTRDVYSTKRSDHCGTEENRPWEENRPQIREKIANFGVSTLFWALI